MADFWGGFGQGFSKQAGKSWERARDRRERKEELEEQRKYQKELADDKERRERARASEALVADMELQRLKPWAKGVLPKGETVRGGLEEVSFRDPSPLFGEQGLRREITQKTPEAALRERSLEQKAAYSKHLGVEKELYKEALKTDVDTVGTMASALALVDLKSAEAVKYKKETDDILKRYEGDSNALTKFRNAALGAGADVAKELGLWRKKEELAKGFSDTAEKEKFEAALPGLFKLMGEVRGEVLPSEEDTEKLAEWEKEALSHFKIDGGVSRLAKDADRARTIRQIIYMAGEQGMEIPGTSAGEPQSYDALMAWAKAKLPGFQTPIEAEKKLDFIGEFADKYDEALAAAEVEGLDGDALARANAEEKKAGNELAVAVALSAGKGWELDVEDGELVAVKVDDNGKKLGYKLRYVHAIDGGMTAHATYPEGHQAKPPAERKKIEAMAKEDVKGFLTGNIFGGFTGAGDIVASPPEVAAVGERAALIADLEKDITALTDEKNKGENWTAVKQLQLDEMRKGLEKLKDPDYDYKPPANPTPIPFDNKQFPLPGRGND